MCSIGMQRDTPNGNPPQVVLETEGLRLRELELADTADMREMLADEDARRIFARVVHMPDYAERWVARNRQRYREDGHGLWALERFGRPIYLYSTERADFPLQR